MRLLILSLWVTVTMYAQTFYVLTGVDTYDPLVEIAPELEIYKEDIMELMHDTSRELKIYTAGHPSRVLAFIITRFSLGETIGYRVELALGEYMKRQGAQDSVFALSYMDLHTVIEDDDIEDSLIDTTENMLIKFSNQYKDDNKNLSDTKADITHENFALQMEYETNYETALTRAKKEGKKLLIFMSTSYCPWCRKLENRLLSKVDINKKIKAKYIPVKLNFSKKNFPKQFREIAFTPTLYIVDPKTQKIEHQFVGYSSRSDFLHVLK